VTRPATLTWFARHELGLSWRDWLSMMTAGQQRREPWVAIAGIVFVGLAHLLAYGLLAPQIQGEIRPDKATLMLLTGSALLAWTLMLSQAMESVTRAFYARADLDLILSSPASTRRVFAVRMVTIGVATMLMAVALTGPFVNVMALLDGIRWLAAYGVIAAMSGLATAAAIIVTVLLFVLCGPKRTRLIAQIVAAVVGAAFVIGIQIAAILSYGGYARFSVLGSAEIVTVAPAVDSVLWWPAKAAMGDISLLAAVAVIGLIPLFGTIAAVAGRFENFVAEASGVAFDSRPSSMRSDRFRQSTTRQALRRKEWILLRRDPWLMSQTLMQLLYLVPPAVLLWRNFGSDIGVLLVLVPVLVMAAGQLAGGLAWLAVSGEDAPDLVASAPIEARAVIVAKVEAVLGAVGMVAAPFVLTLAIIAPRLAIVAAIGIAVSASSAILIQIWFRAQANRSAFRRRQTSSRMATFAEAFSSILWAGTAALVAAGSFLAIVMGTMALVVLGLTWLMRPRGTGGL